MPLLTVISMDGALTGNSLAVLCSNTPKPSTAAEEGFLLRGLEPALETATKMHAPLSRWPRCHSITFPSVACWARSGPFPLWARKKVETAIKIKGLSRTWAGQGQRSISKKQHHCSSPQIFPVRFQKGFLEGKKGAGKYSIWPGNPNSWINFSFLLKTVVVGTLLINFNDGD